MIANKLLRSAAKSAVRVALLKPIACSSLSAVCVRSIRTTRSLAQSIDQTIDPSTKKSVDHSNKHNSEFVAHTEGARDTPDFRIIYHKNRNARTDKVLPQSFNSDDVISPWHEIPIVSPDSKVKSINANSKEGLLYHYVNEIPLHTTAKFEVSTKTQHNAIKQDIKKGKLRHFTYGNIPFNYGCIPQTWEDPTYRDPDTGCLGDNDPIDIVEISSESLSEGGVYQIRVLGVFALIDEGETDWKVIAVASSHPKFDSIHSLKDVDQKFLETVYDWFKNYKTTDGKPINEFAFNGSSLAADKAHKVIAECHEHWKQLIRGEKENKGLWLSPSGRVIIAPDADAHPRKETESQ